MEQRHNWAKMTFTRSCSNYSQKALFIPKVETRSKSVVTMTELTTSTNGQSLHLRRTSLLTPCSFLGPRMIYTSGVITSLTESQTLEQPQDNKQLRLRRDWYHLWQ